MGNERGRRFWRSGLFGMVPLVSLFLFGCATNQPPPVGEGAPPVAALARGFEDVPVPANIELASAESFVYDSDLLRAGVLIYYGWVKVDSLVSYFNSAMPQQGWNLVNSFVFGDAILNFEKGNRSANIHIVRRIFQTKVAIRVGPKSPSTRGPAPPPAQR